MKTPSLIKLLVIICVCLSFSFDLSAQSEKLLSYGIRAGVSAPVLTVDYQPATLYRFSPIIGGFVQYKVMPWISASFDVLYTQFGGNSYYTASIYSENSPVYNDLIYSNLQIHSLETPLQVKISIPGMESAIKPYLSIGGSMAFFLTAYSTNYYLHEQTADYRVWYSNTDVVTSSIQNFDFSGITALGIDFTTDKFNYSMEVYIRYGFTQINANNKTYAPEYRANAIGVKFGFGI